MSIDKKVKFLWPALLIPAALTAYFLDLELEAGSMGCSNCSPGDIPYEAIMLALLVNGLIFSLINFKKPGWAAAVVAVNAFLIGLSAYFSTFHFYLDYDRWLALGMPDRGFFVYKKPHSPPGEFFDRQAVDDLIIRLLAPKGSVELYMRPEDIKGYRVDKVLSQKTPAGPQRGDRPYFASVRLLDESGRPLAGVGYSAVSDQSGQRLDGRTDKDGWAQTIYTPEIESIAFRWKP